jgi:hypothetical protein
LSQNISSGRNIANERNMVDAAAGDDGAAIAVPVDFDGPRQVGISFKEAQALESIEVIVHGGRAGETDGVADFANRWREATVLHAGLDALENSTLTVGENVFAHACIVRVFGRRVKHLFVKFAKPLVVRSFFQ